MTFRIAFVGLPLAALALAADGHAIVWAGICRAGAPGTRRLRRAVADVAIVPNLERSADAIARARPDLLVSWFWTKKIPRSVRTIPPLGAIGVHPSLLPRHRGADPTFWAIERGDTETGVTAHVLDDAYDTGAILGRRRLAIDPRWSSWTLQKKLDRPSLRLLRDVVRAYADGVPPAPEAQDERDATDAPAPHDDLLEIRWSEDADAIARRVRAASPWPGAFTDIGGTTVTLTRVETTRRFPAALEIGEACVRDDGVAIVRAREGAVALLGGRLDDDEEVDLDADALADLVRVRSVAP